MLFLMTEKLFDSWPTNWQHTFVCFHSYLIQSKCEHFIKYERNIIETWWIMGNKAITVEFKVKVLKRCDSSQKLMIIGMFGSCSLFVNFIFLMSNNLIIKWWDILRQLCTSHAYFQVGKISVDSYTVNCQYLYIFLSFILFTISRVSGVALRTKDWAFEEKSSLGPPSLFLKGLATIWDGVQTIHS